MIQRLIRPIGGHSFFIFGPRGTGKSTYLRQHHNSSKNLYINLLDPDTEDTYIRTPQLLATQIQSKKHPWVILDEIQKVPKLLDIAHMMIEDRKQKFIFTGSSARKLKRGSANLLAGRAFVNQLFPFTILELQRSHDALQELLSWGSLPQIFSFKTTLQKQEFLKSYVYTYIQQEIRAEQIVRDIEAFRMFLPIAAQMNGNRLNMQKIAKQVGVDLKTIQNYYQVLEDTLMGFYLPSFHISIRKSQRVSPKFFLFDLGVKRQLDGSIQDSLRTSTSAYGDAFEHYIILEIYRLNQYFRRNWSFSYVEAVMGGEIDLILTKGSRHCAVEIKSNVHIDLEEVKKLQKMSQDVPNCKKIFYVSKDPKHIKIGRVQCIFWLDFLKNFRKI